MATQEVLTLFLASPGDVSPERERVRRIVEEMNASIGKMHGVRVEVIGWETHAWPGWGKDGQAIINEQIGQMSEHALFVGIFWNRFGTPTPRSRSGTEEEFKLALAARRKTRGKRPEIMFYFGTAPFSPKSKADTAQKDLVFDFKAAIEKKKQGLYWTFDGTTHFEAEFRKHYSAWLNKKVQSLKPVPAASGKATPRTSKVKAPVKETLAQVSKTTRAPRTSAPPKAKANVLQPILLDGNLFLAESVKEVGTKWTLVLRPQGTSDDHKIRLLLDANRRHSDFSLVYDLRGGQAQVLKDGERSSDEKGTLWTFEVRFTVTKISAMGLVNFGSMNADEIAQKKAEWLLLAHKFESPAPKNSWQTPEPWLEKHVLGSGAGGQPIFPALWKQVKGERAEFKAMARLWAVNRLFEGGVCDHIETLEIGAVRGGKIAITFSGTRPSVLSSKEQRIEIAGNCPLEIAS